MRPLRRQWTLWPSRAAKQVQGPMGVSAVGGAVITLFSTLNTSFNGNISVIGVWFGVLILITPIVFALYSSIPPILFSPAELVGKELETFQLEKVDPQVVQLSLVGLSLSGKSTLLNGICHLMPENKRTQNAYARIVPLSTNPMKFVALLDASGQFIAQQFFIVKPSCIIIAVMDHNSSDIDKTVDFERLDQQKEFHNQLRGHMKQSNISVSWIHLVLNKRDLWEKNVNEVQNLENFFSEEVDRWNTSARAQKVTSSFHSNRDPQSIATIIREIIRFIDSRDSNEI